MFERLSTRTGTVLGMVAGRRQIAFVIASAIVALWAPSGASAAVLYDQTDTTVVPGVNSQESATVPGLTDQAADDFTVPAGQNWTISGVDVLGRGNASAPMNVYLYANGSSGALPGDQIYFLPQVAASNGPNYSIPISAPMLPPGSYWVSVQAHFPSTQWFWDERTVRSEREAVWQNPGDGFGTGCTTWTFKSTCFPGDDRDQQFKLIGTASTNPPPPSTGQTGQRAAALKRCKKKAKQKHWSKKRLKKCKTKANLLPV